MKYIRNENGRYQHNYTLLSFYGPLFYKHSLAKELWKVVKIKDDYPQKRKEYRRMGNKIYLHGRNVQQVVQCLQTRGSFYITFNFVA